MVFRVARMAMCALVLASGIAHAAAGVNLRWDRCLGDAGVQYRDFACDTNSGVEPLVGSFALPSDLTGVTGVEVVLSVGSRSAALPAWWQFFTAGSCRPTSLTASAGLGPGSTCVDWAQGGATGGLASYTVGDYQGPNHVRVKLGFAVSTQMDLLADQEYHAFTLKIGHQKTVGSGACGGCFEPVVIFLTEVKLFPLAGPVMSLRTGTAGDATRWASWQQGFPTNVQDICLTTCGGFCCAFPATHFDVVTSPPTSARASTWGGVKALYR